jgi:hypothetical protein
VLVGVAWAVVAGAALAAHPVPGALYIGNSGKCAASISQQCVFKFRVSSDAKTLLYVKKTKAISVWECQGGGGEAVFGSGQYDYTIPSAHIHSDGSFSGADGSGARKLVITGSFTGSGDTAALKFVLPNQKCHTPELKLTKH